MRPVKPGDTLRSRMTVTDTRESKSRPQIGLVQFQFDMANQHGETVMSQSNWVMFARRDASLSESPRQRAPEQSRDASVTPDLQETISANPFLDDLLVGATDGLGAFTFSAEEIMRYAKAYDPQPFHTDPEAAKRSLFGALCASGWHTAAVWMKLMAAHRDKIRKATLAGGERPARLGPSPGFTNLKWLKPVYAGDTIRYRTTLTAKRLSASRPGWGIAAHHNEGINQHGEIVISFDGAVFWERRPT
jgi:acyl dehydratase